MPDATCFYVVIFYFWILMFADFLGSLFSSPSFKPSFCDLSNMWNIRFSFFLKPAVDVPIFVLQTIISFPLNSNLVVFSPWVMGLKGDCLYVNTNLCSDSRHKLLKT